MQFQASGFQDLHGGDSPGIRPSNGLPSQLTSHPSPYHMPLPHNHALIRTQSLLSPHAISIHANLSSNPFLLYSSCPPLSFSILP
jgi:hypothetical protein